jgi:TetR/AcrR family transcriptional repressor of mexJK operon
MNAEAQIRKGRKFDQVIDGAKAVFLREGFEGASVDEIARDAGVSKATLYSYFPDKQHLFLAVLETECAHQSEVEILLHASDQDVEETLRVICKTLITFFLSRFGQDMFRVCVAEAQRFPELGRTFYDSGPKTLGPQDRAVSRQPEGLRGARHRRHAARRRPTGAALPRRPDAQGAFRDRERTRPRPRSTASPTKP